MLPLFSLCVDCSLYASIYELVACFCRNFDETDYPRGSIKRIMMEDFMVRMML